MRKTGIILFSIWIFSFCAPVKTRTVYDYKNSFSHYKTFCWLEGCDFKYEGPGYYYDSAAFEKVKKAIVAELNSKGLVQNDNNPDLLIDFHIVLEEKTAIISEHKDYEERDEYSWYPQSYRVYNYIKGSLIIDMIDQKRGAMVWRSHSIGYLETFPKINEKQIQKSVAEALKDYPPPEPEPVIE